MLNNCASQGNQNIIGDHQRTGHLSLYSTGPTNNNKQATTFRRKQQLETPGGSGRHSIHRLQVCSIFSTTTAAKMRPTLAATLCCFALASFAVQEAFTLNPVLDINGTFPYLINKTTGSVIEPRNYMDFENIYTPNEAYRQQQTAQGKVYHLIKAFDFANYFQSDYWHYSSEQDLKFSAYPVADPDKCSEQLNWLESQLNISGILFKRGQQHVNLMSYVDSFGKPESSTYHGHGYWLGSYHECGRVSIDQAQFEQEECRSSSSSAGLSQCTTSNSTAARMVQASTKPQEAIIKTRYCIGKARDADWPGELEDDYKPRISIKVGLCLPESCETLSFGRHQAQLERLMRFSLPDYLRARTNLADMYCLPDARSPIRSVSLAGRIYLTICFTWLLLLLAASSIYSSYKRQQRELRQIMLADQVQRELELNKQQLDSKLKNELLLDNNNMVTIDLNEISQHHTSQERTKFIENYLNHHQSPGGVGGDGDKQGNGKGGSNILSSGAQLLMMKTQASLANSNSSGPGGFHDNANEIEATKLTSSSTSSSSTSTSTMTTAAATAATTTTTSSTLGPIIVSDIENSNRNQHHHDSVSDIHSRSLSHRSSCSSLSNWLNGRLVTIRILQALSISENMREFREPPPMLRERAAAERLRINLNAMDSIKCLCCVLVILGHIVFIHMQHLSNILRTIELSNEIYPRFLMAFFNFVDTFFIISGMLTAYFIFKRFNKKTFANPLVWFYISLLRLFRLSPVYLLVFWFVKTVAIHLSDGPIWDYGTDKNSIMGLCINDHWWKSILYLGNVGTMQPHCILPAWSIIVDSQYSLVIPPVLFLILKHKKLGYLSLLIAVIISTANMSYQLATQTAVRTTDMAKIRLHVYPLISRFAAEFYNTAWNRIGPIAIGILGGHVLYLYDIGKIRRWPWFMSGTAFKFVLFLHLFIFLIPTIARLTDDPELPQTAETDMFIFVLSNATIKPLWSIINTIFLLRLVTDLRLSSKAARLMSHNIWHCLGKLCFASYLIHYEVILILLKSRREGLGVPSWINVAREFSVAFLISTGLSYLIYILFEAPINKLVTLAMAKPKSKS